jgi:hypothetical protein
MSLFAIWVGLRQSVHVHGCSSCSKEQGFLNVRSVEAMHMAQYVPCNEDQHTLPYFDRYMQYVYLLVSCLTYKIRSTISYICIIIILTSSLYRRPTKTSTMMPTRRLLMPSTSTIAPSWSWAVRRQISMRRANELTKRKVVVETDAEQLEHVVFQISSDVRRRKRIHKSDIQAVVQLLDKGKVINYILYSIDKLC